MKQYFNLISSHTQPRERQCVQFNPERPVGESTCGCGSCVEIHTIYLISLFKCSQLCNVKKRGKTVILYSDVIVVYERMSPLGFC